MFDIGPCVPRRFSPLSFQQLIGMAETTFLCLREIRISSTTSHSTSANVANSEPYSVRYKFEMFINEWVGEWVNVTWKCLCEKLIRLYYLNTNRQMAIIILIDPYSRRMHVPLSRWRACVCVISNRLMYVHVCEWLNFGQNPNFVQLFGCLRRNIHAIIDVTQYISSSLADGRHWNNYGIRRIAWWLIHFRTTSIYLYCAMSNKGCQWSLGSWVCVCVCRWVG